MKSREDYTPITGVAYKLLFKSSLVNTKEPRVKSSNLNPSENPRPLTPPRATYIRTQLAANVIDDHFTHTINMMTS